VDPFIVTLKVFIGFVNAELALFIPLLKLREYCAPGSVCTLCSTNPGRQVFKSTRVFPVT